MNYLFAFMCIESYIACLVFLALKYSRCLSLSIEPAIPAASALRATCETLGGGLITNLMSDDKHLNTNLTNFFIGSSLHV